MCRYQRLVFRHKLYQLREERDMKPETFASLVSALLYEKRLLAYYWSFCLSYFFFLFGILKWTYYATFAGFSFCTTAMYCYHILMVSWHVDALGYWIKVCEISINNLKTLVKWVPIILFFKCFYLSFGEKCH